MTNTIIAWAGGFLMGTGITLGMYAYHLDTGAQCLERYQTAEDIAVCVDILNGSRHE